MLLNKLKLVLVKKGFTIKDVVMGTTLSRNTLSNIVNNTHANISNRTLDTLCMFLNVSPTEIYEYHPFNIEVNFDVDWDNDLTNNSDDPFLCDYMLSVRLKFTKLGEQYAAVSLSGIIEILKIPQEYDPTEIQYSGEITFSTEEDKRSFKKTTYGVSQFAISELAKYLYDNFGLFLSKEGHPVERQDNKIVFKLD